MQKIAVFRRGLDLGKASLALAHELHGTMLAPVDALITTRY
ncbi:hypothetical protein [Bradyrhizobium sp. CSA112]|nr:hypothetical protein [Bradyrhizobium sp. CSA112]